MGNIYFGVNNVARKVKKIYFGVNNKARKVKKVYVGINGKARLVWQENLNIWCMAERSSTYVWRSVDDCKTFTKITLMNVNDSTQGFYSTSYNGGFYVANVLEANDQVVAWTSEDASTWSQKIVPKATGDSSVAFAYKSNKGLYVCQKQKISFTPDDGNTWFQISSPVALSANNSFAAFNNIIVVIQNNKAFYYSTNNGTTWTSKSLDGYPTSIFFSNGKFCLTEEDANNNVLYVYQSSDGVNWTNISGTNIEKSNVRYVNNFYIGGKHYGYILYSTGDGNWTSKRYYASNSLRYYAPMCYNGNKYILNSRYSADERFYTATNISDNWTLNGTISNITYTLLCYSTDYGTL